MGSLSPIRLGGLLLSLLLLLPSGGLVAQTSADSLRYRGDYTVGSLRGTADYSYKITDRDTLREGNFRLRGADATALLSEEGDEYFAVVGSYTGDRPSGEWRFTFGDYTAGSTAGVVEQQYRLNVNGTRHTAGGALMEGRLQGDWTQRVQQISESELTDVRFRSAFTFAAGVPQGTFQLEGSDATLLGRFRRDGSAHDSWSLYADLATREQWHFREGRLDSVTYLQGDDQLVPVLAGYSGPTREINLDERYLDFLTAWQGVNDGDGAFATGGAARLLADNARYYRRVGALIAALGGDTLQPTFRVRVPDLPLSTSELAQLDSVRTYLRQIDTLASTLSNNAAFAIAETTDPEVAQLRALLDSLRGTELTQVRELMAAYERGILELLPRQAYYKQLWPGGAGAIGRQDLSAVTALTAGVLDRVRAIRGALGERLNTRERQQVITALDEQLMRDFDVLDSLVNVQEGEFRQEYGLDNLRTTARRALQAYASEDDPLRKQDRARDLIACVEELDALVITVARLPQRAREIEALYTDEVWNNFTATVMKERVQRRVSEAYAKLIPYFQQQLRSPLDCPQASRLSAQLQLLHERMRELRGTDTEELEDQLKQTDDPRELLNLLGVTPQP